eukprot:CAMPEP_0185352812 /NCGR_PEP_ID=MMETSP1364-20130426/4160_1 /TAXON_ID=38817 /ORGANISM="Gephyrocapsa oceanica, Strain RCC1303" /LENGTH=193 /DNA_ID=CAMNT_0027952393 /DNA_START=212 /DNA_END=790 /DNA_ORIENTATION=+
MAVLFCVAPRARGACVSEPVGARCPGCASRPLPLRVSGRGVEEVGVALVLHLLPAGGQSLAGGGAAAAPVTAAAAGGGLYMRNWFVLDSPLSCLRRSSSFSQRAWSVPKPSVRGSPGATGASVGADRWYESRAAAAADGVGLPAASWLAAGWAGEASTGEYWKAGGAGRAAGDSACGAGCTAASCGPHVAGAA